MVPPEYLLGDPTPYVDAYKRLSNTYSKDGMFSEQSVQNSYKVLQQHNSAVSRAPVLWIGQTYANAFVEQALKKYH